MDEEDFRSHVQTALAHLYDYAYLDAHPLARALRGSVPSQDCGRALRRLIVDAIQELRPPSDTDENSARWHTYQCLYLRYVEPKPVVEIARDLYVSDRQERRRHRTAVATLNTVLWQRWTKLMEASPNVDNPSNRDSEVALEGTALDTELERLGMARSDEVVNVREVIESVVAVASRLADFRGVTITSNCSHERTFVVGNRVVLRQALLGVIVYAIHHSALPQIAIEVVSNPADCLVSIRFVPKLLSEVGREDREIAEGGLLESDRLLRTQRGTLRTTGDDAVSTIVVRLPQGRVRTVLIVDDNRDLLDLFRRYLNGSLYETVEATSGDEALALARKLLPAGIVLDVMMPSRDGWDILQSLRADPATRELPVIICSVLRQRELALSLGASGSLIKPVNQRSLLEALDRYCLPVV